MSFVFGLLDFVLTAVLLFDTLGLIYQFRTSKSVDSNEYIRICFSWILFLTISSLFSCERKGFFGTLIRLILFASKAFVTLPILGGTMKIHKYLIDDKNAEKYIKKVTDLINSKVCSGCQSLKDSASSYIKEKSEEMMNNINKEDNPGETPTES